MRYDKCHIGQEIESVIKSQNISYAEFARRINMQAQNVPRLLSKPTIDTGKLIEISLALNFDFFIYYRSDEVVKILEQTGAHASGTLEGSINNYYSTDTSAESDTPTHVAHGRHRLEIDQLKNRVDLLNEKIEMLEKIIAEKDKTIQILINHSSNPHI